MSCPNCGYCPHCGRGGYYTRPWWGIQDRPYHPNIWYSGTISTSNTPSTISDEDKQKIENWLKQGEDWFKRGEKEL